jgi:hypothetical protein
MVNIVLGGDGHPILGGWMEAPLHNRGENFLIEDGIEAVNHRRVNNRALIVDGDFNYDIASDTCP